MKMSGCDNHKKKKRKLFSNPELPSEKSSKKKKLFEPDYKQKNPGIELYENNEMYTIVVAKPDFLPQPPDIFKQKTVKDKNQSRETENFMSKFLNINCFNVDVDKRYSFMKSNLEKTQGKKKSKDTEDIGVYESELNLKKKKENIRISSTGNSSPNTVNYEETEKQFRTGSIYMYNVLKEESLIFHVVYPSSFSFQGELKMTLISGEVEILGYTLSASAERKTVEVYSPAYCLPLNVQSVIPKHIIPVEELRKHLDGILSDSDTEELFSNLGPNDSVLLLKQAKSQFGKVINKYFDKPLFPIGLENISSSSISLKKLESIFNLKFVDLKEFRKNPEWDAVSFGQRTILCGGKNVGKSTLLKYYANKLLSSGEKVVCLDFDPGQPEFAPPGCLTAVLVDEPLLGPNFTHMLEPKVMTYFGDINVTMDPEKYLECVKVIINFCKSDEELSAAKWLVNTMGFTKGLGEKFMVSIIRLLQPDTIIQIRSRDFKCNYSHFFTPRTVDRLEGLKAASFDSLSKFDLHVISSYAERKGKQLQGGLMPRQLRDIMSISYFSKMVTSPHYNFNAVQPYLISFSKIYLGIQFSVSTEYILKAFNGNTVSLSFFEPSTEEIITSETDPDLYFKIVIKPKVAPCLALGFVRGIDCNTKKFYVISHLTSDEMNKVNCLSLGRVSPPHSMFLKQDTIRVQPVYTSVCSQGVIQRVKRMFRVPASQQMRQSQSFQR